MFFGEFFKEGYFFVGEFWSEYECVVFFGYEFFSFFLVYGFFV